MGMPENTPSNYTYACPSCRASLAFDPKEGALTCPYCGRKEQIPNDPQAVKESSFEEYLQHTQAGQIKLSGDALEVVCKGCSSAVTFTPPEVAAKCPFCGMAIVTEARAADPTIAPQGVLPFRLERTKAVGAVREWIQSRWFAPNALRRFAVQGQIQGVYLPFWTYDAFTVTPYHGSRGEHYYVQETYTATNANGERVTRTRSVQRTRWYPASGSVRHFFDDVLCPATKSVSRSYLEELEPWDLEEVQSYDPAYLAGFKAQRYQVDMQQGFAHAQEIMEPVIEELICKDIGGDEQRIESRATHYSAITFKHLLLPVYIGAYRLHEKAYQVLVNARTGEVQGQRPYSVWKIASAVVLVTAVLVLVLSYLGR